MKANHEQPIEIIYSGPVQYLNPITGEVVTDKPYEGREVQTAWIVYENGI